MSKFLGETFWDFDQQLVDTKTESISWNQFDQDIFSLYKMIEIQNWDIKLICAVTRGGLAPVAKLSYLLDIRNIEVIGMYSYKGTERVDLVRLNDLTTNLDDRQILIVDDLSDTGRTFKEIREQFPEANYVSLYTKPLGTAYTDVFVKEFPQDVWLEFPWSNE